MLKSCLSLKENIDVNRFPKTTVFVKRQNIGYQPKKSKTLTMQQITKFILEASDEIWLLAKTVLIFGIFGACRRDDIVNLNVDDVEDNGRFLIVFVRNGKTQIPRTFTITNDGCSFNPCDICRKYLSLRPKNITNRRLFIKFCNGKCTNQNVGMHTIAAVPCRIAKFLELENPEDYTGHCFRRTSATMLVEGGGDVLALKNHGGWRSSTVAEGYVEQSVRRKVEISKKLFSGTKAEEQHNNQELETRTNEAEPEIQQNTSTVSVQQHELLNKAINIQNNTNCTFTINIGKL